jgi:hypothetical protein
MVSTAHSYAALSRRLDGIARSDAQRIPAFCGYSRKDVAWRFLQRSTELGVFQFTRVGAEQYRSTGALPDDESTVDCGGLRFEADRRISLSAGLFLRAVAECCGHWAHALVVLFVSFRFSRSRHLVTLLHGVGIDDLTADGSDRRFLDFCRNGPVVPLAQSDRLVVQATRAVPFSAPARVRYGRVPLLVALAWLGLAPGPWLRAIACHLGAMLSFSGAVLRCPGLIVLGRDAAYHASAQALSRSGVLQDVLLTNSNYFSQALWMWALPERKHRTHLIWYSQNNYPMVYADDPLCAPIPNLRFIRADIQWVWTDSFKQFLERLGSASEFRVVGPILWHLPGKAILRPAGSFRIALFDVTPIDEATERRLGLIRNYYAERNVVRFIREVIEAAEAAQRASGRQIEVLLKHKRGHASIHATGYADVVGELVEERKVVLIAPTMNLYDLIDRCDIVVVAPFSSPLYVALARGKPAIWYDPTASLVRCEDEEANARLIGGTVKLAAFLQAQLRLQ